MTNALARQAPQTLATPQTFSLVPRTFAEAHEYAKLIAQSDFAPKDYKNKPGNVVVAIQMGAQLGLAPLQALQSIAVVNGRPSLWGAGLLAVCQTHPDFEDIAEVFEGDGDKRKAVCTVKRRGRSPVVRSFSVHDAKTAGLWGVNTWAKYPDRMMQHRARGLALQDTFADAIMGLSVVREHPEELAAPQTPLRGSVVGGGPESSYTRVGAPLEFEADIDPDTGEVIEEHNAGSLAIGIATAETLSALAETGSKIAAWVKVGKANPVDKNNLHMLYKAKHEELRKAEVAAKAAAEYAAGDATTDEPAAH